jgi:hypothetical protein
MTVEEFAQQLSLTLDQEAILIGENIKNGKSSGYEALVDAAICATLHKIANSILKVGIKNIYNIIQL